MNVVQRPGETGAANSLKQLERYGQAPWLDFIQRSFVHDGSLARLIEQDGLRGVTSNPAIFQKAMGEGTDYDEGFQALAHAGDTDPIGLYETLAIQDIQAACDVLRPVHDATGQRDGFVSLEVSPYLALRTDDTVAEARRLWEGVGRANLMVKVPGTAEGAPAIRQLIADGINVNVTLLFSQASYQAVAEAFMAGLEERVAAGKPVAGIASVASFFVSRIDAKIDKAIDERVKAGEMDLARLRGKVAIANAKLAYQLYLGMIATPRWQALDAAGAQPQRLLWASTGVKDKAYSDVLYVEELIGRDTVNTIPPATMDAFRDHGQPRDSLAEGADEARRVLEDAERAGLNLDEVTRTLVVEGVASFAESADTLLGAVAAKRAAMLGDRLCRVDAGGLPEPLAGQVKAAMETWRKDGLVRRLWAGDAALWTGADEARWLGWLGVVDAGYIALPRLQALQDAVRSEGFRHVLLLGMGGSSLGPEVLAETFGRKEGFPELLVLDSTDPAQVAAFEARVDLASTLVIVSSKSGSTLEPNILKAYFWDRMQAAVGAEGAGQRFVAVTDPGSKLEAEAKKDGFRAVFSGDPAIGGRYSVLSPFGLVPAAAMGLDLQAFLDSAALAVRSWRAARRRARHRRQGRAGQADHRSLAGPARRRRLAGAARRREHRQERPGHRAGGRRNARPAGGVRRGPAVRLPAPRPRRRPGAGGGPRGARGGGPSRRPARNAGGGAARPGVLPVGVRGRGRGRRHRHQPVRPAGRGGQQGRDSQADRRLRRLRQPAGGGAVPGSRGHPPVHGRAQRG